MKDNIIIEKFGQISYSDEEKEWFGRVDNISPTNKVELSIEVTGIEEDLKTKLSNIKTFARDYNSIMTILYDFIFQNTSWKKTLKQVTQMYFLTAVSLRIDGITFWVTLEPASEIESIYNQFLRFTIIDRTVAWANF